MATCTHRALVLLPTGGFVHLWSPSRRVLLVSLPSVLSCLLPELGCKIRHFRRGKSKAPVPRAEFLPTAQQTFPESFLRAPASTLPGPSFPPRTLPSPGEGPTCLPSPVPRLGHPANSCPAAALSLSRDSTTLGPNPQAQGRQNRPRDRLTPRRPPEAGSRAPVSAPPEGVRRGAELFGPLFF